MGEILKKSQAFYITKMFYIFLLMLPVLIFILAVKFKVGYLKFNLDKTISQSYSLIEVFPEPVDFKNKSKEGIFYYCEGNECNFKVYLN